MLFFGRIVAAVVLGWALGVAVAWPFMMPHESPGALARADHPCRSAGGLCAVVPGCLVVRGGGRLSACLPGAAAEEQS